MIEIPAQLWDWRFILLGPRKKEPIELGWTTSANYPYNDQKLVDHINKGGNYGVLGDNHHIIIDGDIPEIRTAIEARLPETFTVRTPGHEGRHYYYLSDMAKPIRLFDRDKKNVGDVQGIGKQVVGPGCTHPNGGIYTVVRAVPPKLVSEEQIRSALADFIFTPPEEELSKEEVMSIENRGYSIKISDVVDLKKMKKRGDEYYGAHPVHGSDTGQNFWVNPSKNVWTCFRHNTGGGPLSMIAVLEGIIPCEEALSGVLRGDKFKQILRIAREKGYLKNPESEKILEMIEELRIIEQIDKENSYPLILKVKWNGETRELRVDDKGIFSLAAIKSAFLKTFKKIPPSLFEINLKDWGKDVIGGLGNLGKITTVESEESTENYISQTILSEILRSAPTEDPREAMIPGRYLWIEDAIWIPNTRIKDILKAENVNANLRRVKEWVSKYAHGPAKLFRVGDERVRFWSFTPDKIGLDTETINKQLKENKEDEPNA